MQNRYTIEQINEMMNILLYTIQDTMPSAADLTEKIRNASDINIAGDLLASILTSHEKSRIFAEQKLEKKLEARTQLEPKETAKLSKDKCSEMFWHMRRGSPTTTAKIKRDNKVGILYLDEKERENYRLEIKEGEFSFPKGGLSDSHHLLFGLDKNKKFYGKLGFEWKNYGNGFFGHASFKAGGYLIASGELYIVKGKLKYISSNSGHYLPAERHMRIALYNLHKSGVDLSNVILVLYHHQRTFPHSRGRYLTSDCYNALEFLQKHENDCIKHNDKMVDIKKEIQLIREITNRAIAQPDSTENLKPHRIRRP